MDQNEGIFNVTIKYLYNRTIVSFCTLRTYCTAHTGVFAQSKSHVSAQSKSHVSALSKLGVYTINKRRISSNTYRLTKRSTKLTNILDKDEGIFNVIIKYLYNMTIAPLRTFRTYCTACIRASTLSKSCISALSKSSESVVSNLGVYTINKTKISSNTYRFTNRSNKFINRPTNMINIYGTK